MEKVINKLKDPKNLILLVILLAVFFRFYQLGSVPPGLYPDVAVNGTNAIEANETGNYRIFYQDNNGREGLFINLIALSFKIFGVGIWQLKLVGAIFGVLAVWGIYLLAKEMFGQKVALYSSLFMATSLWAVNFSRIGFRANMVPFIIVFGLYFLIRNYQKPDKPATDYILAGLIMGLGFHTYISFRIAPIIPVFLFIYTFFANKELFRKSWKKYLAFFFSMALIALPMFLYFQLNASEAAVRTGQVSILNPDVNKGNLVGLALKTIGLSLGMFNFYGDPNWRHNFSGLPALNFLVGIFFIIGLVFLIKTFFSKKEKFENKVFAWILGSTFFAMLMPAIMTEEGMPHSLRSIGAMIPTYIFAGLGAFLFFKWLLKKYPKIVKFLIPITLTTVVLFDMVIYFQVWAKKQEVVDQFTTNFVEMGNFLNNQSDDYKKYLLVNRGHTILENGFPVNGETVRLITYKKSEVNYLKKSDIDKLKIDSRAIIIPLEHSEEILTKIQENSSLKILTTEVTTTSPRTSFKVYVTEQ